MKLSSVASIILAGSIAVFTGCGGGGGSSSPDNKGGTPSNVKNTTGGGETIKASDAYVVKLDKVKVKCDNTETEVVSSALTIAKEGQIEFNSTYSKKLKTCNNLIITIPKEETYVDINNNWKYDNDEDTPIKM